MRFNPMMPGARPFDSFLSQQMPMGTSAIRRQIGGGTPPQAFQGFGQRPRMPMPQRMQMPMPPRMQMPMPPRMQMPMPSMPVMPRPAPIPARRASGNRVMDLYLS